MKKKCITFPLILTEWNTLEYYRLICIKLFGMYKYKVSLWFPFDEILLVAYTNFLQCF